MKLAGSWEQALRRSSIYLIWILAALLLVFAVFARIQRWANSDPVGVTGDLYVLSKAWTDLTGTPNEARLSLRVNQYGLATALGLLVEFTGKGWAQTAAALSMVCSVLIVPAAALLVFAMGGTVFDRLAAAGVVATSSSIIDQTLRAESESAFILFSIVGVSLIAMYWRQGRLWWLILGIPTLAIAMAIRGPAVFHALLLAAALTWAHFGLRGTQRPPHRRLALTWTAVVIAIALYALGNAAYTSANAASMRDKLGVEPFRPSYTTYIVYDGILMGPFPDGDDWARRFEFTQDPSSPVKTGKSALAVIWENRRQYVANYFEGVYLVTYRFLEDKDFNILGFWPLALGVVILARRRDRVAAAVIASWIGVYVLVLPGISVQERQVWPAAPALALPGAYAIGFMLRSLVSFRIQRISWAYWSIFAVVLALIAGAAIELNEIRRVNYKDYRAAAAKRVFAEDDDNPVVYGATPEILSYGHAGKFVAIQARHRETDHLRVIEETHPDFILFDHGYAEMFGESFRTLHTVINDPRGRAGAWEMVWSDGASELWGPSDRVKRIQDAGRLVYSIDASTDLTQLQRNIYVEFRVADNALYLDSSGPDPIFFTPNLSVNPGEILFLRAIITSAAPTSFQVFYKRADEESYSEKNSVAQKLQAGENYLSFAFPDLSPAATLRIDPADAETELRFNSFEIFAIPE